MSDIIINGPHGYHSLTAYEAEELIEALESQIEKVRAESISYADKERRLEALETILETLTGSRN